MAGSGLPQKSWVPVEHVPTIPLQTLAPVLNGVSLVVLDDAADAKQVHQSAGCVRSASRIERALSTVVNHIVLHQAFCIRPLLTTKSVMPIPETLYTVEFWMVMLLPRSAGDVEVANTPASA